MVSPVGPDGFVKDPVAVRYPAKKLVGKVRGRVIVTVAVLPMFPVVPHCMMSPLGSSTYPFADNIAPGLTKAVVAIFVVESLVACVTPVTADAMVPVSWPLTVPAKVPY